MAWNILIFTILLINAAIVSGQCTPTISYITQDQIKHIGDQVDLNCTVHDASDYPVVWEKHDIHKTIRPIPLSTYATLIYKDSRYSVKFDAASATYTLSIKDIKENDAGLYQCHVILSVSTRIIAGVGVRVRPLSIIFDNSTSSLEDSE